MKLKIRWVAALAAAATATSLALTGCSSAEPSATGGRGQTLTIASPIAPSTFIASNSGWANEAPYLQAVYDGLLRAEPDGTIVPWLATKWSYDDTNTKLSMTLRDDVTFSDGTEFTPEVAKDNLLRFRDGTSPQKQYLAGLDDVTVTGDDSIELDLAAPNPSLLYFLTQNPGLQESPENFGASKEATDPVGSGAYLYDAKASVVGSSYVFTRNTKYWAKKDQHYEKVVVNVLATPTAVLNAIKGGQVDGATITDVGSVAQAEGAGFTITDQSLNFFGLMLFDRDGKLDGPLEDVQVRQAINYALDRKALLKAVAQGKGEVTTQIFSPDGPAYDASLDSAYDYDPAKAKQLLSDAGYADGLTLQQPQSSGFPPAVYALIQQQLGDVGITVDYSTAGPTEFIPNALAAKYPSMLFQLKAAPTPWETWTLDLAPTAAWNPFHLEDATAKGYADTMQSGTSEEADAAAKQLNRYVVEQAWFAPIYRPQQFIATNATTTAEPQVGNAYPYLWNFAPKA